MAIKAKKLQSVKVEAIASAKTTFENFQIIFLLIIAD